MEIEQENIATFRNQVSNIKNHFSHEIHGELTDYFKRTDDKIIWLKPVSYEVVKKVEEAAKKYLIAVIPTNL